MASISSDHKLSKHFQYYKPWDQKLTFDIFQPSMFVMGLIVESRNSMSVPCAILGLT